MKRLAHLSLCLLALTSSGCAGLMHELQPHRLWRMNYQEPAGRTDGVYFSVSDPLDARPDESSESQPSLPSER